MAFRRSRAPATALSVGLLGIWIGSATAKCVSLAAAMKANNLSQFGKLTAEAAEQSGASNVTFVLGSTVELPEEEKYTVFAPWDLGWQSEQLEDGDPLEVLQSHFVEWYLPISYIKLSLAGPVSAEDGFLLESAAGTDVSVSLNKKGTFYVTSEGMSEASKVLQTDIETCIGVMHVISTPLVPERGEEDSRDPPRAPDDDREERDGRDQELSEDGNVPEVSAEQSEQGGTVPGVSIVSDDVEQGDQDNGGLGQAAVWGIVGAAVLALFAFVAGVFALHKRKRLEADEEFDRMWKEACESRRVPPSHPPFKPPRPTSEPSSNPPFSWDLLPAVSMNASHACLSHDGQDACIITPESSHVNSHPNPIGYGPTPHVPTHENSKDLARYLVMATDTSGNLQECSGGVGSYRCNASEYGGSSSLLAKHGKFGAHHSGRLGEGRSGSSLPVSCMADSGPLDPRRRGPLKEAGSALQGSKVGGTYGPRSLPVNHRMTRSMDSCISNECFEEEAPPTGHFTPRNSLDEVAEVDCSSQGSQGNSAQSVSLEFEGTERLRDLDGEDTRLTITPRTEVQGDNDTNTIDLSQSFQAVKKRALASQPSLEQVYNPSAYLHDADFVHFSPTRDLRSTPEDTVVPESVQESIFESICDESDTVPDSGDRKSAEDQQKLSIRRITDDNQDFDLDQSLGVEEEEEEPKTRATRNRRNVYVRSPSAIETLEDETPAELPVSTRLVHPSHAEMDSADSHESSREILQFEGSPMRSRAELLSMELTHSPDSAELVACSPEDSKLASRHKVCTLDDAACGNPVSSPATIAPASKGFSDDSAAFTTAPSE